MNGKAIIIFAKYLFYLKTNVKKPTNWNLTDLTRKNWEYFLMSVANYFNFNSI